jgi:hypothetical protein
VQSALALEPTVFLQFKPCSGHPLVLRGRIISTLALRAGHHY